MNEEELKALAAQLRQPHGEHGLGVADMMNQSNSGMTKHSIQRLDLVANDCVLELGHGNGAHVSFLMEQHQSLVYHGLEISELMHEEAKKRNTKFSDHHQAFFHRYDGETLPFSDQSFDKIFTVNTIYFWNNPQDLLMELYRVLRPEGRLNITFAEKSFMEQLPFTTFGFTLYDMAAMRALIAKTSFTIVGSEMQTETVTSKTGESVERDFTTISLTR